MTEARGDIDPSHIQGFARDLAEHHRRTGQLASAQRAVQESQAWVEDMFRRLEGQTVLFGGYVPNPAAKRLTELRPDQYVIVQAKAADVPGSVAILPVDHQPGEDPIIVAYGRAILYEGQEDFLRAQAKFDKQASQGL